MRIKILLKVKENPGLYIGKCSLERLKAFVDGYMARYYEENSEDSDELCEFDEYIGNLYNINTSHNCYSIINFVSATEEEAFHQFYRHLDDFLNRG